MRVLAHLVHKGSSDTKMTSVWLGIDEDRADDLLDALCEPKLAEYFDYKRYRATPLGEKIVIQVAEQLLGTDIALMKPYLKHAEALLRELQQ